MKCKNCGRENRSGIKFCEGCGEPLSQGKEAQAYEAHTKKIKKKTDTVWVCSQCGQENNSDIVYCVKCGFSLHDEKIKTSKKKIKEQAKKTSAKSEGITKKAERKEKRKRSRKKLFEKIKHEPYRYGFYVILGICVLIIINSLLQSALYEVSTPESRNIADSAIASRFPLLSDVEPDIVHTSEEDGEYITFTYQKNIVAEVENGLEMDVSLGVVVRINRSTGEYDIFEMF